MMSYTQLNFHHSGTLTKKKVFDFKSQIPHLQDKLYNKYTYPALDIVGVTVHVDQIYP